jgi:RimJ/RimL family protein N-acetyltransferase
MRADEWQATPEKDEIGWLVDPDRWGEGLATEGARAALDDLFGRVGLPRVIAFALPDNRASLQVMERCGMSRGGIGTYKGHDHVWYAADAIGRVKAPD